MSIDGPADLGVDPLSGLRRDLVRLRGGRALADPARLLRLGPTFWYAAMPDRARPTDQARIIEMAGRMVRHAIERIDDDLQRYALVEFNIDEKISAPELGDRQHALAEELRLSVKTVRRRGDVALQRIAVDLVGATPGLDSSRLTAPRQQRSGSAPVISELARFWKIVEKQRVDIVCSVLPEQDQPYYAKPSDPNYLRYAKFADLDSLVYIRTHLAHSFPDCYVRDFPASEYFDSHADHLLILGGPDWNSKASEFQEHLPIKFFWNEELGKTYVDVEGKTLFPEWSTNNMLMREYGMFARLKLRQGLIVNLLAGCLTYGVLGASQCFLDPAVAESNIKLIDELIGDDSFAALMTVRDFGGIAQPPDLRSDCVALYRSGGDFSFTSVRVDL